MTLAALSLYRIYQNDFQDWDKSKEGLCLGIDITLAVALAALAALTATGILFSHWPTGLQVAQNPAFGAFLGGTVFIGLSDVVARALFTYIKKEYLAIQADPSPIEDNIIPSHPIVEESPNDTSRPTLENKITQLFQKMNAYSLSCHQRNLASDQAEADKIHIVHVARQKDLEAMCFELHTTFYNTYALNKTERIEVLELALTFNTTAADLIGLFEMCDFPTVSYTNGACLNSFFYHLCTTYASSSHSIVGTALLKKGNPIWPYKHKITSWEEFAQYVFSSPENCKAALRLRNVSFDDNFIPARVNHYLDELSYGDTSQRLRQGLHRPILDIVGDFSRPWDTERQWACHLQIKPGDIQRPNNIPS